MSPTIPGARTAGAITLAAFVASAGSLRAQTQLLIQPLPDGTVELSWTNTTTSLALESCGSLSPPIDWSGASESQTTVGGRRSVLLAPQAATRFFRLRAVAPASVVSTSPVRGESGVAVTRETIFRLTEALAAGTVIASEALVAVAGGRRLLSRAEVGRDGRTITLFYLENLPGSARVRVTLVGDGLEDAAGQDLDADADGQPGGTTVLEFSTSAMSGVPGTSISGHVYAAEPGPEGGNLPLAGVTVTVDGAEETLRATTDVQGSFRLDPCPAGRFFVHVDGRTAVGSQWPGGAYYPFVGKAWEAVARRTNNLANGNGVVYLPRVQADALQTVSPAAPTVITFPAAVVATNPALAGVSLTVPAGALFSDNGTRGGRVGMAPVPSDRLPEPLPPGLNLPVVITVQTDGPLNFDPPVPARFPNLPDPVTGLKLPPGAQTVLWSFNHDTGRWEGQGTCTVTADGDYAVTDPGVGIRQPGWHGVMPGSPTDDSPDDDPKPDPDDIPPPRPDRDADQDEDDDCDIHVVYCPVTVPPPNPALCALSCIGDYVSDLFTDDDGGPKSTRTPLQLGLCAGNILNCTPGGTTMGALETAPDYLTVEQENCMDACMNPSLQVPVIADCDDLSPCEFLSLLNEQGAVGGRRRHGAADVSIPDTPRSWLIEQRLLWKAGLDYHALVFGTRKIGQTDPAELGVFRVFLREFRLRIQPASPAGARLSVAERNALLALPRPSQFTAEEWTAMIDRLDRLAGDVPLPGEYDAPALLAAGQRLAAVMDELQLRGWQRQGDGLYFGLPEMSWYVAPPIGSPEFPQRAHYFRLRNLESGFEQRGRLNASAKLDDLILSPDALHVITYVDPETLATGAGYFQSATTGELTYAPTAPLYLEGEDSDADGLLDAAEAVLGTNPDDPDSDDDGLSDAAEAQSGSNPLDGQPPATGSLASIASGGAGTSIAIAGEHAFMALGSAGLGVYSLETPAAPVLLTLVDTPGSGLAVVADHALAAVADGDAGLTLIDVTTPGTPVLVATVPLGTVEAVALHDRWILGGNQQRQIAVIDRATRALRHLSIELEGSAGIDALQVRGDLLYALTSSHLYTFQMSGPFLLPLQHLAVPGGAAPLEPGRELLVAGSRAYVGTFTGFSIFDVSDPASPQLLGSPPGTQAAIHDLVAVGPALLLPVTSFSGPTSLAVSLYDVSDPSDVTRFLGSFETPGNARATAIDRGLAFVAAGSRFGVINLLSPGLDQIPPTVALGGRWAVPNPRAESNTWLTVPVEADDNGLVREVRVFRDGVEAGGDGSYPFEVRVLSPAAGATSFVLRAEAIDLAGHRTLSAPVTVSVVPDATAPEITAVYPAPSTLVGRDFLTELRLELNEPPAGVPTNLVEVVNVGPDGQAGTADDVTVTIQSVTVDANQIVALPATSPLPPGRYRVSIAAGLADSAGNAMPRLVWPIEVSSVKPSLKRVIPAGRLPVGATQVDLMRGQFEPPLSPARSDEAQFTLTDAGPDRLFNTGDDVIRGFEVMGYTEVDATVALRPTPPLGLGNYRLRAEGPPLTTATVTFELTETTNRWISPNGGTWQTSANWLYPVIEDDRLLIAGTASPIVSTNRGNLPLLRSLVSAVPCVLASGRLRVAEEARFTAPVLMGEAGWATAALDGGGVFVFEDGLELRSSTLAAQAVRMAAATIFSPFETRWVSGDLYAEGTNGLWVIDAAATFTIGEDARSLLPASGGRMRMVHSGLLEKPAGTNTALFRAADFVNRGQVVVDAGGLQFNGYQGDGVIEVGAGALVALGGPTVVNVAGAIRGPGTVRFGALDGSSYFAAAARVSGDYAITGQTLVWGGTVEFLRAIALPTAPFRIEGWARFGSTAQLGAVEVAGTAEQILQFDGPAELASLGCDRGTVTGLGDVHVLGDLQLDRTLLPPGGVVLVAGAATILRNLSLSRTLQVLPGATLEVDPVGISLTRIQPVNNQPPGLLLNAGVFRKDSAERTELAIQFDNHGLTRLTGGTLRLVNPATLRLTQFAGGELRFEGGVLEFYDATQLNLNQGLVAGTGVLRQYQPFVFSRVRNGSVFQPGGPIGVLRVEGADYEQTATGELRITLAADGHGRLECEQILRLGGRLRVELAPGFSPAVGQTFEILAGAGRTGEFAEVVLPDLGPGKSLAVTYPTGAALLTVVP